MNDEERDDLISRYLAGASSDEEARRLSVELESDPEARAHYVRLARIHAVLATGRGQERRERAAAPAAIGQQPWAVGLALAASFAGLALLLVVAWSWRSAPRGGAEAPSLAQVGTLAEARWVTAAATLAPGDALRRGARVELASGTAGLRFASGAVVTLIGPCIFEVTSGNGGFLLLGQLKARAETPASKGFTVQTRTARFVDVGTEFVAAASPDGQSRVDVTAGEVDVLVDGGAAPQRLRTGQALAVEAGRGQVFVRIESGEGTAAFRFPTIEPPSAADLADRSRGRATIRVARSNLHLTAPIPSGSPERLLDGRGQSVADSPAESVFFDNNVSGALLLDLGAAHTLTKINIYSWHQALEFENRVRAVQKYTLFGFAGDMPPPVEGPLAAAGWVPIARVNSDDFFHVMEPVDRPAQQASSITGALGPIGRYRYLLWEVQPTESRRGFFLNNTFYAEFDVYGEP
jgi:ferric-dicitrate binding protein FerR (iron transport regulator)